MIINSILDNDLYKFTMQNVACKSFPNTWVKYNFIKRSDHKFPKGFAERLQSEVNRMKELQVANKEIVFLRNTCPFLDNAYLDFLKGYRYNLLEVNISQNEQGELSVVIEGYWYRTILWEVPLLAIISELYYQMTDHDTDIYSKKFTDNTKSKGKDLYKIGSKFADFGTRRRYSFKNHDRVLSLLKNTAKDSLVGTSNVFLAMVHNIQPIGTFAHEFVSAMGVLFGYTNANKHAMEEWVKIYNGNLGIALTDTFHTDTFFKDFDTKMAKLFDGVRHDSGDPFEFGDKAIEHHKKLGIDPKSKTLIFSDSLNVNKVHALEDYFSDRIKTSYGIGTNLTNDVDVNPLNIVIKLVEVNKNPAIKLSDVNGKETGETKTIEFIKWYLNLQT